MSLCASLWTSMLTSLHVYVSVRMLTIETVFGIGNVVHGRTLLINYDQTIRLECRGESRTRKTTCLLDLYRTRLCMPWYVALAHSDRDQSLYVRMNREFPSFSDSCISSSGRVYSFACPRRHKITQCSVFSIVARHRFNRPTSRRINSSPLSLKHAPFRALKSLDALRAFSVDSHMLHDHLNDFVPRSATHV